MSASSEINWSLLKTTICKKLSPLPWHTLLPWEQAAIAATVDTAIQEFQNALTAVQEKEENND